MHDMGFRNRGCIPNPCLAPPNSHLIALFSESNSWSPQAATLLSWSDWLCSGLVINYLGVKKISFVHKLQTWIWNCSNSDQDQGQVLLARVNTSYRIACSHQILQDSTSVARYCILWFSTFSLLHFVTNFPTGSPPTTYNYPSNPILHLRKCGV